jgi:hypothetical protein
LLGAGAVHHIKPAGQVPSDAEKIQLFGTLVAYSGKYVVEGDKVTHKVDVSWNETWTGTDQVRFGKVDGNKLAITTAVRETAVRGAGC